MLEDSHKQVCLPAFHLHPPWLFCSLKLSFKHFVKNLFKESTWMDNILTGGLELDNIPFTRPSMAVTVTCVERAPGRSGRGFRQQARRRSRTRCWNFVATWAPSAPPAWRQSSTSQRSDLLKIIQVFKSQNHKFIASFDSELFKCCRLMGHSLFRKFTKC